MGSQIAQLRFQLQLHPSSRHYMPPSRTLGGQHHRRGQHHQQVAPRAGSRVGPRAGQSAGQSAENRPGNDQEAGKDSTAPAGSHTPSSLDLEHLLSHRPSESLLSVPHTHPREAQASLLRSCPIPAMFTHPSPPLHAAARCSCTYSRPWFRPLFSALPS